MLLGNASEMRAGTEAKLVRGVSLLGIEMGWGLIRSVHCCAHLERFFKPRTIPAVGVSFQNTKFWRHHFLTFKSRL